MAYTINLTDGTIFAVVADGTVNTDSSMTLVGKNYAGYGEFLDENFIHLLENSSNTSAPGDPLIGQLWWDKTTNTLKVWNGTVWKVISGATSSNTAPSSAVAGDLWFDSINQQLNVYTGTAWIIVGPTFTAITGTTGAIPDTITDSLAVDHVVVKFYVEDEIVAIMSKDATFTPASSISGFITISPGMQLATTVGVQVPLFQGTATNAQLLDSLDSAQFLRSDQNDTTSGTLGILNDNGLSVGADSDFRASITGADVFLSNQTQDGNIVIRVNDGGAATAAITIDGATVAITLGGPSVSVSGNLTVSGSHQITGNVTGGNILTGGLISATGNVTAGNVTVGNGAVTLGNIVNNNANGIGNIGSSAKYFNTIFAKATSAQYADVAERFEIDIPQLPGTVVELGGPAEITKAIAELSENVFGVISTNAAYLMNAAAGDDQTHPPVAMTGRVPIRVIGSIYKGDRLVSAGDGKARSAKPGEATAFNVIGRALESKPGSGEGTVEAIVTVK